MSFPTLPFEILHKTFRYFPDNSKDAIEHHQEQTDIFNCSLVSRDWRAAALPLLWRRIIINYGNEDMQEWPCGIFVDDDDIYPQLSDSLVGERESATPGHIDRASCLRDITLAISHECVTYDLAAVVRILQLLLPSQLRRIRFSLSYNNIKEWKSHIDVLQMILLPLAQNLEYFRFGDYSGPLDRGIYHSVFSNVKNDTILKNIPKSLRRLILEENNYSSRRSAMATIPANCDYDFLNLPELRYLKLSDLRITSDQIEKSLRTWHPNFHTLHIRVHCLIRSSLVLALADHCRNLRSLTLTRLSDIVESDTNLSEHSLLHLIDSLPRLRILSLVFVATLSNRFLARCASQLDRLQILQICQYGDQLTGEGVVDMSGWKTSLKRIHIESRRNNDRSLKLELSSSFIDNVLRECKHLDFYYLGKQFSRS